MKILLVEDDELIGSALFEALVAHRYTVDVAADGQTGLELATTSNYDLILLDWLIPKLNGISLCRQLRSQGYQKPILLLTAKDSNSDVVQGLDAGADDYIVKPYDLSALMARIRALLRRGNSLVTSVLTWGDLCLNPVSGEVTCGEQLLSLTPKEYSLLELFLRNPQRIFSRSAIMDRLWSLDGSPAESAVTVHIKELRQKLKTGGMTEEIIETVYGLGYRLKSPPEEKALRAIADSAGITLCVSPVSAQVWVAPDTIIQTLTNLLSNAIKFSPSNTTITLSAQPQSDHVLFQVKDQGRGIPADKVEAIFGRFQQVDVSDSRQKGGTGLGLAICQSIVQQHGGHIWAESTLGEGSTFYFTLPVPPEQ